MVAPIKSSTSGLSLRNFYFYVAFDSDVTGVDGDVVSGAHIVRDTFLIVNECPKKVFAHTSALIKL